MGLVLVTPGGVGGTNPAVVLDTVRVGPSTGDETNTVAERVVPIACVRLDDLRFRFDSSFVGPQASRELGFLERLRREIPGAPVSVFGHADPVGDDAYNKTLAGRRAEAIYGLLTRQVGFWENLYDNPHGGDNWGIRSIQSMLTDLGHYGGPLHGVLDGPTKAAVKSFQESPQGAGLAPDGDPGPQTRRMIFPAYMALVCVDEGGRPYELDPKKDFLARGADPKGKGDLQGCGEFNPIVRFSKDEEAEFQKSKDKTERNRQNAPNRRVLIFLFAPGLAVDPQKWPCPRSGEGPAGCKKRFFKDGENRRGAQDRRREYGQTKDTFACRFYDRMAVESPCEQRPSDPSAPVVLDIRWEKSEVIPVFRNPDGTNQPPDAALVSPLVEVRNIPDGTAATIEVRHADTGALVRNGTIGGLAVQGGKVVDPATGKPPDWSFQAVHLPWDPFDKPFYFFVAKVGAVTERTSREFESRPQLCLRVVYFHATTSDAIADAGGLTTQAEMAEIAGILESNSFHGTLQTTFTGDNLPLADFGAAIRNTYTLHHASHGVVFCPIHKKTFSLVNSVRTVCPVVAGDPPKSVIAIGTPSLTKIALFGGTEIAQPGPVPSVPRYLAYLDCCDGGFEPALANAFLSRGTQNVIAFGMTIPDSEARQMAREFHNKWAGIHKCDPSKIADVFFDVSMAHAATMRPILFGAAGGAPPPAAAAAGPVAQAVAGGANPLVLT